MLIKESNSPIDRKISRFLEAQKSSEAMLVIAPPLPRVGTFIFYKGCVSQLEIKRKMKERRDYSECPTHSLTLFSLQSERISTILRQLHNYRLNTFQLEPSAARYYNSLRVY